MEDLLLIIFLLEIILLAIVLLWRNQKVYVFKIKICDKWRDVLINFLDSLKDDEELYERYEEYEQLKMKADEILSKHSYESMFFSLKPLKPKYWFTNEEIEFMDLNF